MANVTNLKVAIQAGTTDTLYATWDFNTPKSTVPSSDLSVGDTVMINSGAKYYNGVEIDDWVIEKQWIVSEVIGDRVVIDKSADGKSSICSAIASKNLTRTNAVPSVTVTETLDYYEVKWTYYTGDSVWFTGTTAKPTDKIATYNIPKNALKVSVSVKPVAKTYKVDNKETSYWTGTAKSKEFVVEKSSMLVPATPSAPKVSVDGYVATASLDNISDPLAESIIFVFYRDTDTGSVKARTIECKVVERRASCTFTLAVGKMFRVCCFASRMLSGKTYTSEQSPFTDQVTTVPNQVTQVKCAAESESSVKVTWKASVAAKSYEIEYAIDPKYFDTSSEVQSATSPSTTAYITGIDPGKKWYFRVRAVNDVGESAWSSVASTIIGSKPAPPTTWSATSSVMKGDKLKIYWVHNSEDSSAQTGAEIRISPDHTGYTVIELTFEPSDDEETSKIYSHEIDLSEYSDGTQLGWRVRTKGIREEFSDWSERQSVTIYAPPFIGIQVERGADIATGNYLVSLPYVFRASVGPLGEGSKAQFPVAYHVSVVAQNAYETTDALGLKHIVSAGSEIYSRIQHSTVYELYSSLQAGNITLENDQKYKLTVTVTMSSGLTASDTIEFTVRWLENLYSPDARISINKDTLCANISPFCLDEDGEFDSNVVLSVYRREYDGGFVEIATDIDNDGFMTVVDPYPSLDYARYRIVARSKTTSVTGYEDLPGIPVDEPGIVMQWDDDWTDFHHIEESEQVSPSWAGSMVRLRYNVDVSETYDPEASLIKYIGRKNPVAYYGTQKGQTSTWSTVIPKYDKETLYAIRRLAAWSGNVYVREPSGLGYWARVAVTINNKHKDLTTSISFSITRVEGGTQ